MTRRILIAEDSATQAEALRALLQGAGYEVERAANGETALATIESADAHFDAVISDVVMPGAFDGYELCRRIKHSQHRETPVMLLTSLSDPFDIINGLESGADNFFTKPYDAPQLLIRLANLLDTKMARRQSKMQMGIRLCFMGREFNITSDREQILDLLVSTFEEAVRQNRELMAREAELEAARAELARYAGTLEADLHRFFELSHDMICVMGFDGNLKRINPAWRRTLGWPERELVNRSFLDIVHHDDRSLAAAEMDRLSSGSATDEFATRVQCKDGSYRWLEWKATAVPAERTVYANARDVTERKRAMATLEVRARQQSAVARFGERVLGAESPSAVLDGAVELVAQTLKVPMAAVYEKKADGTAAFLRAGLGWNAAIDGHATVPVDESTPVGYALTHDKAVVVSDLRSDKQFAESRLLLDHGVVSGMAVVIPGVTQHYGALAAHDRQPREFAQDDVHFLQAIAHSAGTAIARLHTESAFRHAQRMEAVGRLAGGVAHDFNNMLTAIYGYGELIQAGLPADHDLSDDVAEILKAAERAAGLTRQLLAFSRQQVMQLRVVNLNDVVVNVKNMLRRLIGEDVDFVTSLADDLHSVRADPGQLEQVLMNLCVNARDAMPDGGTLAIETANVSLDGTSTGEFSLESLVAGEYVTLAVSDSGTGMDTETRSRIFEPFFTTKGPEKGTGLGLATVYGIIKQTGGQIFVQSEVGRGTTFKIYLPSVGAVGGTAMREQRRPTIEGGRETILLAEDEEQVRRVAQRVLEEAGYTVLRATDGGNAEMVSAAHEGPIHLLVTDMVMPQMNGRQLAERLLRTRPGMRVLYLSGYTDATMVPQGFLDGDNFLQKPFNRESLRRKVRDVLDAIEDAPR